MEQGVEVVGLHFITPFFGYQKKGQEARYRERVTCLEWVLNDTRSV